jgi:hypothetical protein
LTIADKIALKCVPQKEFEIDMKKKKGFFRKETVDTKKFKLTDLNEKCAMEKDIILDGCPVNLVFMMREPIKKKEMQ